MQQLRRAVLCLLAASITSGGAAFAVQQKESAAKKWEQLQDKGTTALDANQYWIAEPTLKSAIVAAAAFGPSDIRLAKSLGELGRLYTVRGRFDLAEPFLEEELHVKELALGKDEGQTIPAMGSLVRFYLLHGTTSKADPMTEQILSFVEGKIEEQTNAQFGGHLKVKKGQALEGWAGTAAQEMRDPVIDWAITCDDLGNIYRQQCKFDMADRLYKAALDVKTTVLGKEHLSLANSYDNLGILCAERGDQKEALSYYKDALEQTKRILPPDSPQVYARLEKLAKCCIKNQKYSEAEELYKQALDTFWKGDDGKCNDKARALFALGCLYCDQKRYSAAVPYLNHAVHLCEEVNGPLSISLVPYLEKYAYTLYYLGRKPETDALRARANNIAGT